MKIFYLITKSNWGGAQRYVFDLATHFAKKSEVVVILGGEGVLKKRLEQEKVRVVSLPKLDRDVNLLKDIGVFFELIALLRKEKPDIVHLNSSKIGGLGALASRLAGVPKIIFTGHGWAFNEDRSVISQISIYFLHWLTVMLCHKTIAVSQRTADDLLFLPLMKERVTVIHNGIDETSAKDLFDRNRAQMLLGEANPILNSNAGALWIGTISELHKNKGLEYMIEAIAHLKNEKITALPHFIFVIIGEGEERNNLEKLIIEKKLSSEVFLLGRVDNAGKYLKAFDIFTLTSITEALPYVVLEAGLASLPIIASTVGGIPEIVSQLESGILTKPRDVREISRGLEILVKQPEKRLGLGEKLHQAVISRFSSQQMLEQTEKLYQAK